MITEIQHIVVSGLRVEVVRKDIKNLHLGVYPPNGRVRVAVPLVVTDEAVRLAVIDRLGWIKKQKAKFFAQPRQSRREMVTGESHYFLGRRYRLRVHENQEPTRVNLRGTATLDLFVRPYTDAEQREIILMGWYREQLKALIPPLLERWQPMLNVQVAAWGIRKMKTKWGSCNPTSGRVWFNLELAKKPEQCLEYIVVHELLHLRIRRHDQEFTAQMERCLPNWKQSRDMLNRAPLGHEDWLC